MDQQPPQQQSEPASPIIDANSPQTPQQQQQQPEPQPTSSSEAAAALEKKEERDVWPSPEPSSDVNTRVENSPASQRSRINSGSEDDAPTTISIGVAPRVDNKKKGVVDLGKPTISREAISAASSMAAHHATLLGATTTLDDEPEEEPSILPFGIYLPASKVYLPFMWQSVGFLVMLIVVMFLLCMALTVTTWRYPDPNTQFQLPDLALDNLPDVPQLEHVTDALLGVLVVMCLSTCFASYLIQAGKLKPFDEKLLRKFQPISNIHHCMWSRFFVCFSALSLMRIVVISATILPSTDNKCKVRPDTGNFWWNAFIGVATWGSSNVHCGDLLFSGHTAIITLAACACVEYGPLVNRYIRPGSCFLVVCTWFTILLSRSHYTDDILIALYLSITCWVLIPHDAYHGAPAIWQVFIQPPWRVYRRYKEAIAERNERRLTRSSPAFTRVNSTVNSTVIYVPS
jgi:shingomyelin synthase